ncbi:hypothetical protein GAMM_350001 [Gammaproteobacteria bacterium]
MSSIVQFFAHLKEECLTDTKDLKDIPEHEMREMLVTIKIAENLKKLGVSNETIRQATGMNADEVDKL